MRRCPECDAMYEDHVEFCFIDGFTLGEAAGGPLSTPRMALQRPPDTPGSSRVLWGIAIAVILFLLLIVTVPLVVWTLFQTEPVPVAIEAKAPPPVPIAPSPAPVPEPAPMMLEFSSTPENAEVFEGEASVCRTPCTIEHPDFAPLPREFVMRLPGHVDHMIVVESAPARHHATMRPPQRTRPAPSRVTQAPVAPAPVPVEKPSGTPEPSERGSGAAGSDLKDPFNQ